MGLFRKKRTPVQVGASLVAIGPSGVVDVRQFWHDRVPSDVIAALAPITMVIARAASVPGARAMHWVEAAGAHDTAASMNESMGTTAVGELGSEAQVRPDAHGVFYLTPSSKLMGAWEFDFHDDDRGLVVLGALWEWATRLGEGDVVRYALDAIGTTGGSVDWSDPSIIMDMPQMMLDYGAHQAALGSLRFPGDDV